MKFMLSTFHKRGFLATASCLTLCWGVTATQAQDKSKPPTTGGAKPSSSGNSTAVQPGATAASATMQLRREISGNFLCRFVTDKDETAALVALPAPIGSDNVVAMPVPSTLKAKDASLEVVDTDHSRVARLPVNTMGVTALNDSAFKYIQTVLVPVQVKGKGGLTAATVTLASADKSYNKSVTLTPSDAGTAKFANVPLGKPITATVTEGANPSYSATQTLTVPTTPEGYRWPLEVSWADAHTVPLSAATASTASTTSAIPSGVSPSIPSGSAVPATPIPGAYPAAAPPTPAPDNPLGGIISTVVSVLFLGGVGYGLYWAYQNGHIKNMLDKLNIQTQPAASGGVQISPFDKPQKMPIQPITDGTAEPLGSGNYAGGVAMAAPPIASAGPRLVATMGTYAGNIFPLSGGSLDIGRDTANAVSLPDDTNASRRHAILQVTNGQAAVTDNGSSNGTFVNGVRIPAQSPHPLNPGDEVQIGMTRFRYEG